MIRAMLLALCLLAGCAAYVPPQIARHDASHTVRYTGSYQRTALGVQVFVPRWLDQTPVLRDLVLREVDQARVPPHVTVYVRDPGPYSLSQSETGLVLGHTNMRNMIHVAFRVGALRPLLPALEHEMEHVRTRDPERGH